MRSPERVLEALFATLNMKPAGHGKGYEIFRLLDMLNGESTTVKKEALIDMQRSGMYVRTCVHDCACRLRFASGVG